MAIYFCMNCYREFVGPDYYEYGLTCPHCLLEIFPMFYSRTVPINDLPSKDGASVPTQSFYQLLCFPMSNQVINPPMSNQMMNSPITVSYGIPYDQVPPHMDNNGSTLPSVPALLPTELSYCNSSNGSIVHSLNSVEGSEAQSFVNDLSPNEVPGNNRATECLKSLAGLLKGNVYISHPMRRKLGKLINCPLNDEESQLLALNFCFSFGERVIFELMRDNQNLQDSISNLLASIRSKGCQFLGLPMQDEILKLILQALENGKDLTRKELVTFVLERLQQHRQTSKKKIGDVVQLLYRACCFNITKRDEMSALMQLKENLRDYKTLREQHDSQVVQIANDAGISISIDTWALLLYNDVSYTSYMENIIAKLKSKSTFDELVKQFEMFAQRRSNVPYLARFSIQLKNLAGISVTLESDISIEAKITTALEEVYQIVREFPDYKQQYKNYRERERGATSHPEELNRRNQSTKSYKSRLCRNVALYRNCPRGKDCNYAHSRAEYNCNRNIS